MDFSDALRAMKDGTRCRRPVPGGSPGWAGCAVRYQPGTGTAVAHLRLTLPDGTDMPWTPLSLDLLAGDWETVSEGGDR